MRKIKAGYLVKIPHESWPNYIKLEYQYTGYKWKTMSLLVQHLYKCKWYHL